MTSGVEHRGDTAGVALRIWALLLGMGVILGGNGLQASLLTIAGASAGFPDAINGLIMAGYYVGFVAGSMATPGMIARVGHIRTFAAHASLASVAILVHGIFIEAPLWFAMRLLTGFAFAGLYVVVESWLNAETDNAGRGALLAIYMIISQAGLALGQLALNLAPPTATTLYLVCSIIISVAAVPILLSAAPQPSYDAPSERLTLKRLVSITPTGAIGCAAAGAASGLVLSLGALYAQRLGLTISATASFMMCVMLGGALLQWPIGKLSDLGDRRRVILGVAFAGALCVGLLHVSSGSWAFYLFATLAGGLILTLYPLALSYANDWLSPEQVLSGSGGLVMLYGVGAVAGPILAGALMGISGAAGFILALAAVLLALAGFVGWRMTVRDAAPDQEDFVLAPAQTIASAELWAEEAASDTSEDAPASA